MTAFTTCSNTSYELAGHHRSSSSSAQVYSKRSGLHHVPTVFLRVFFPKIERDSKLVKKVEIKKTKKQKQKKNDEAPHTWKPRARALVAYIIKRESRAIQSSSTTTPNFNTELRARLSDELWAREKRWKRVQGPARNLSNKHVYRNDDDDDSPNIHQAEAEYLSLLWLSSAQCQLRLRALNAVSCFGLSYSVCNERESSSVCSELFVFKTRLKNCSCTSGELGLKKSEAEPIDDLKRFEKIDF